MRTLIPFIRDQAFTPEIIEVMSEAFTRARPFLGEEDEQSLQTLATRIITLTASGIRDPDKLASAALSVFCDGRALNTAAE